MNIKSISQYFILGNSTLQNNWYLHNTLFKYNSTIFKQQLTNISTVLNNTGNTTQLLTSFNALDVAQQKVLLSSKLLTEEQKSQCATMVALSSVNSKYTAEQLTRATGVSAETLANWGLVDSTDSLTIAELAELAVSDKQAKNVLDKIIAQNAQAVANGEVTASNIALASSEGGATLATGAFTTAIKANISAMWTWMTTTPLGWLTLLAAGVFAAVKAYDALTVSVEEQKEKMEESLSAYEDAKSELSGITTELENQEQAMNELLAKEKLTYAEKGQLEELQAITRELRIQKDLAEKEEDRTEKQLAKDATDLFDKQFGDYEISEQAINKYQSDADITGNTAILISDENDISAMIAGYKQFNELLDEAYGSGSQDDIDHFKSLTEDLEDSIFTTAQELQTQQDNISAYYESIKNTPYEDLTTEQKEIVDTYNAISNAIALIYQQLDPNTWNSMQVDNIFSTDGIEKTKDELVAMAQSGELTPETIKGYTNLNNALGETTLSAQDLCDEMYALADAEKSVQDSTLADEMSDLSPTITSSISQIATQLEPQFAKLGEAYKAIFTDDGFTLDDVDNSMLEGLRKSFAEIEEEVGVAFDATKLNSFFDALTNGNSSAEQVQQAFDDLATAYFYSTDTLAQLNEETADSIAKQLEELGVVNAKEVVYDTLNAKTEALALQEQLLAAQSDAVSRGANFNVESFLNQAGASEIARTYLFQLITAEQVFNNQDLNTADKIAKLKELATAYGQTAIAARIANLEKANEDGHVPIDYDKELASLQNDINNAVNNVKIDFKGIDTSGASKAGGDAGDAYVEAYEKELKELENLRDRGEITEAEYLSRMKALYEKYFAGISKYQDKYFEEQGKYLSGMLDLYNSALSGISKLLGNKIDAAQDGKEAAISALEEEKEAAAEAYQAQIDAIDDAIKEKENIIEGIEDEIDAINEIIDGYNEQIDVINDEIDAMREANEERKRQQDLMLAQYNLQKMLSQRTKLVNICQTL